MAKIDILEALRLSSTVTKNYIDRTHYTIAEIDELLNGKADVDHEIHLVLGEENTNAFYGDKGKVAYDHSQADHAPSDAQKNSDITKEEIEDKLTGDITSHIHSQYLTNDDLSNTLLKTEQSLTDSEKDQVRSNLGYIGRAAVAGDTVTVDGKTYTIEPDAEIFGDYANNIAIGSWSIAEGSENIAVGRATHVEGAMNKGLGVGCHVEGVQCTASGYWSHAEGERTIVTSYASHAEGSYTNLPDGTVSYGTASGYASHVEGGGCHATGSCSHAQGLGTRANGYYSNATGAFTVASGQAQTTEGRCNIEDTENKYIHIAGNGTWNNGESAPTRANAYTLDWNGNAWFSGKVTAEGTPTDDKDLTNKTYVDNKVSTAITEHNHDGIYAIVEHGTHLELGIGADNAFRGDYGNTAYNHSQTVHAPSDAQKNSDITQAEIEAKLTGTISTHDHSDLYYTKAEINALLAAIMTNEEIDTAFNNAGL